MISLTRHFEFFCERMNGRQENIGRDQDSYKMHGLG